MDVGDWLRGLGLGQYEALFRESDIDAEVLPELTDQHLKDLGVSFGHRLKMVRAIRDLIGDAPVKAQSDAPAGPKPQDVAERRQLTDMFRDLVGSTALYRRAFGKRSRFCCRRHAAAEPLHHPHHRRGRGIPPHKGGGFGLRLKAGSVGPMGRLMRVLSVSCRLPSDHPPALACPLPS